MCVCLSALAATYLVFMSKVRRYRDSCRLLKICIIQCVDFAENVLFYLCFQALTVLSGLIS